MKIKLGVSACTIGQPVRFDGGHKQFRFLTDKLSEYVEFQPVCPEMAAGLGTPRPTIRQVIENGHISLQGSSKPDLIVTDVVDAASTQLVNSLDDLCGFVFCSKSPTCGMERVKVYRPDGNAESHDGVGVFAAKVMQRFPYLPCEETGRLNDALIRESFLNRIFTLFRFKQDVLANLTPQALVDFHSAHKFLVLAHHPDKYRQLGRLIADLKSKPLIQIADDYVNLLNQAMAKPPTRKKHTNVMMHIQGFLKQKLGAQDTQALTEMLLRYQQGVLPLSAPVELLKHHQRHIDDPYLAIQHYFEPYPEALKEVAPL